jgi:hypothetical protein
MRAPDDLKLPARWLLLPDSVQAVGRLGIMGTDGETAVSMTAVSLWEGESRGRGTDDRFTMLGRTNTSMVP